MSGTRGERSKPANELSLLRVLVAVLIVAALWILFVPPSPSVRPQAYRVVCLANLRTLHKALRSYSQDHGGKYPPAEAWCDSLAGLVAEESFRCRKGEGGRCDYAMNPMADPCSPADTVLLFECSSGWNRFGGPALMSTSHHEGKGCNVLFVDGQAAFVKAEEIPHLKWEGRKQGGTGPLVPGLLHH